MMQSFSANINYMEKEAMLWIERVPATTWDAAFLVQVHEGRHSNDNFVLLRDLVEEMRQGVAVAAGETDEIAVETVGVADLHPLLVGAGEQRFLSTAALQRHILHPGDVLVARVGPHGCASV